MLASLVTSLQDLTPLIVALLATGLLILFRPQIVQLIGRLTSLHAHVGNVQLEAELAEPSNKQGAKLEYQEMDYMRLSSGQSELGYKQRATDRWLLAQDHTTVEVMRVQETKTEILRLARAAVRVRRTAGA